MKHRMIFALVIGSLLLFSACKGGGGSGPVAGSETVSGADFSGDPIAVQLCGLFKSYGLLTPGNQIDREIIYSLEEENGHNYPKDQSLRIQASCGSDSNIKIYHYYKEHWTLTNRYGSRGSVHESHDRHTITIGKQSSLATESGWLNEDYWPAGRDGRYSFLHLHNQSDTTSLVTLSDLKFESYYDGGCGFRLALTQRGQAQDRKVFYNQEENGKRFNSDDKTLSRAIVNEKIELRFGFSKPYKQSDGQMRSAIHAGVGGFGGKTVSGFVAGLSCDK